MLAFIPTNRLGRSEILRAWRLSVSLLLTWAGAQAMHAQTGGGLGCVIDAGISPQEVCKGDHVVLGGNPTIPFNLSQEYASISWSVLEGDSVAFDPSPYVPNPSVQVDVTTTFLVELVLNDGSVCSSTITLIPITEPMLDLQGSWTQCGGSTFLSFYNTSPSNSVAITYDVDWGDGSMDSALPFATAFQHDYASLGQYDVQVSAMLGTCVNEETIDVFLGTPPEPIELDVPEWTCSGSEVAFEWSNLDGYPLGSSWDIQIDGSPAFNGAVTDSTATEFTWSFGESVTCLDALATHSVYAQLSNACLPAVNASASFNIIMEPEADLVLAGDSCAFVQMSLGPEVECPGLHSIQWNVTSEGGEPASLSTYSGGPQATFWTVQLDPGEYQTTLEVSNPACGSTADTAAFCVEMSPPGDWATPGVANGQQFNICVNEVIDLWIDPIESICGSDISGEWFVSPMTEDTDPEGFETLLNEEWHRSWSFQAPGIYLIELEGQIGCGDLDLFASVVVTELPEVTLTSYDNGVPDQVLCRGDEVSVVAEVSGVGLNSGAYDLNWSVLNSEGQSHPSASASQYGDSTLIVQSHPSAPAEDIFVALEVSSACGPIYDTLHLEVEGNLPLNYWLVSGSEGPVNNGIPEFVQCQGDSLELGFEIPGAAVMNVYSQTFDLWDLTFDEAEGTGELTWLSNGLNWDFELEYLSAEGCQTLDTLSFRTIFRPEVFVDAPGLVCQGDASQFSAVVFPGSTSNFEAVNWSVGGSLVQSGSETDFAYVMSDCLNNPTVTCTVIDEFGCQASAPAVTAPISCPPSTSSQFYSCGEEGDTLCQSWVNSPAAGWLLDDNMWLDEDSLGTCVVVDSMYVHHSLTWYTTTELGCQQTNHMCWGVGALDSLGQCTEVPCSPPPPPPCDAFLCEDSLACNYGIAVCCLDSCVFPESIGANELAFDSLVFCQSWTPYLLEAESPWIGNWSGPRVSDNSQVNCAGTQAYLDISVTGEWDIYFHGGLGSCMDIDTVHVVVHEIPQYDGPNAFQECHGVELDLGDVLAQDSSLCWSLDWLGEENNGCDTSAVWLVNGSGYVAWNAVNEWGCSSLNTTIYIEDLGRPNAIVGGDTVLCNQAIPNIMAFEFGAPYALGCNPTQGVWEGQGANLEFFTEVWTGGNCVDAGDPWIDSLWTFTPDSVGVYEWVWTVTDCNGCVDRDTLNITVVEPTPPLLPQLTFCMDAPVGPVTPQGEACWFGSGISPDYIFDPVVAGEGTHEWVVRIGEGSCAMTDTVEVEIFDVPHIDLVGYGPWPCYGDTYAMCVETEDSLTDNWVYDWQAFPNLLAIDTCSTACCDIENVDATNAMVVVTNEHGCTSEDSWIINLAPTPEVVLTDSVFLCKDGGTYPIPTAPLGGTWTGEHLTETGVFTAEEVGVFVLHYEFINVQNCMDEDSVVVVVTDIPQPTIVTPQLEYCLGSSALLYSDMDGVWSGPGIDGSGAIQQSIPGTYSYQFTSGSGSCLAQDSIDITFLELPFVDLPVDTILCPGSPLEIEVPAEAIDSLNLVNAFAIGCEGIGGTFPAFTFEPEFTCGFSMVVVDDHGCLGYDDMTVIVPLPTPSYAGPPEVLCMGEELQLEGQIVPGCATEVTWSGALVDETGYVTADTVGVHWVELTYYDCFGCFASGQREVLVLDAPLLSAMWSDTVVCEGEEVDLMLDGYGGSLGYNWDWVDSPFEESPTFPWLAQNPLDSIMDLTLWATAGNLCNADSVSIDLTVWPAISAEPSTEVGSTAMVDTVLCAPVSLSYQAYAAGALDWVWSSSVSVDTIDTSVAEFSVDVVDEVTTFDLGVLASLNQSACTSPSQWTVTVVPEPVAELSAVEAFCGDVFAPEVEYTAEYGDVAWNWTGGALPTTFPDDWELASWGTTSLSLTVTSTHPGVSCVATDEVSLAFYDQPVSGFELITDSVVCAPGTFQIVDASADAQSISWFVDYVGGILTPQDTLDLLLPFAGQFGLTWVAEGEGNCTDTLFVADVVEVLPSPEAGIWSNQPLVVPWRMEGTEFIFNDVSVGNDSTIWTVGDSTIIDQGILNFLYEAPGTYAIGQQVFNDFGCQDTVSLRFEIVDELNIHVPTAFTPNGDFVNDVWKPIIAGVERIDQYSLQVVSRSGQIAFETTDPEQTWDALDVPRPEKLEDVQNSVFRYILRVLPNATPLDPDPVWMEYTGHVMIVD